MLKEWEVRRDIAESLGYFVVSGDPNIVWEDDCYTKSADIVVPCYPCGQPFSLLSHVNTYDYLDDKPLFPSEEDMWNSRNSKIRNWTADLSTIMALVRHVSETHNKIWHISVVIEYTNVLTEVTFVSLHAKVRGEPESLKFPAANKNEAFAVALALRKLLHYVEDVLGNSDA